MIRAFVVAVLLLAVGGCATSGEKVTDFSDRSVVYGWVDISSVDANRLNSVWFYRSSQPETDKPFQGMAIEKFKGGHLYYSVSMKAGEYNMHSLGGQKCIGPICTQTVYEYELGKGDDSVTVSVSSPGVYSAGEHQVRKIKRGLFKQSSFDVGVSYEGPTRQEALEFLLEKTREKDPLVQQRILTALQEE